MSDENKDDKNQGEDKPNNFEGWQEWVGAALNPFSSILGAMKDMEKYMEKHTKLAIDLAPGDVIKVGHVTVYIVGVRFQELDLPKKGQGFLVEAAGAEARYESNDWCWSANIMYDSPFLRFNPGQEITIERVSPTGTNTLDKLIALREKIREEQREAWEKGGTMSKWFKEASGEGAYTSKVEAKEEGEGESTPEAEEDGHE